jgi:hypothetical protein
VTLPENTKEQVSEDRSLDKIVFGIYCGECSRNCATMYAYNMNGNRLTFLADYTDTYFKNFGKINFSSELHDSFYYRIGNAIVMAIPDSLLINRKNEERFGCPDCTDGCGIYFETDKNGERRKFYIDKQTDQLSGDVKIFAEFLIKKIREIEAHK